MHFYETYGFSQNMTNRLLLSIRRGNHGGAKSMITFRGKLMKMYCLDHYNGRGGELDGTWV